MLFNAKDFERAAHIYSGAQNANNLKGTTADQYNSACSRALANKPNRALSNLNRIVIFLNHTDYGHIKGDTDFMSLYSDKRWLP